MANQATLKDMMERALFRAGYPTIDKIDPELRKNLADWVNGGLAELHDLLVKADATADYFKKTSTISIVAGTEEYALPSDFYKLKKVYFLSDSSRRYRVARFDLNSIDGYKVSPVTSGSVELWYVPMFHPLRRETDLIDQVIPPTWEDVAILSAASVLLLREQSDASAIDAEKAALVYRIMELAEPRDEGEADSILDVSGRFNTQCASYADDSHYKYRLLGTKISFVDVRFQGI